ncbi:MAG TPA: hypothetical protein VIU11_03620 [Nakamurella sp.]
MSTLIEEVRDETAMTRAWLANRVAELREQDPDRGNNSVDNIVWIAIIAAGALVVAGIIIAKLTAKANELNLQ